MLVGKNQFLPQTDRSVGIYKCYLSVPASVKGEVWCAKSEKLTCETSLGFSHFDTLSFLGGYVSDQKTGATFWRGGTHERV